MPDSLCPFVPYDAGDAGIGRPIRVQTVTLHRTIGTWAGDYSVGKHRTHDQGTFQFLIGQAPTQWVQFFPVDRFASHAAGSNEVGPGVEISGQNGEALTDWQIDALGQILRWLRDEWGIADTFFEGDPRVYYDQAGPSGFVCHNSVFYPDPQYIHHDYITADEFARAIGDNVALDLADFAWLQNNISGQGIDGKTNITNRMVLDAILALKVSGGGLTEEQVRAVVRDELNKTKLSS